MARPSKPAEETYWRCAVEVGDYEALLGLQLLDSDDESVLHTDMLTAIGDPSTMSTPRVFATDLRHRVRSQWPGRAYFIEVCAGTEKDGWVQIFQPWDGANEPPEWRRKIEERIGVLEDMHADQIAADRVGYVDEYSPTDS